MTRRRSLGPIAAVVLALALAACATREAEPPPAPVEIAVDAEAAAGRLAEAVRIPTVSWGPGLGTEGAAFDRLHALLEASYPKVRETLTREVVNAHSRLYTWEGSGAGGEKPILLMAHLDVVPIAKDTEGDWTQEPLSGLIDGEGMIWGRGSLDDKLSVLGLLEAVEQLLEEGFTPRRTVYLAFGHDEEIDGARGALAIASLLEQRGVRLDYVLDEGSIIGLDLVPGVDKPVAMIGVAEKGYLSLRLTATGAGGHSSIPPEQTAIGRLARALTRLEERPMPAELRSPVAEMLVAVAPEMPFVQRLAMENQWAFGPLVAGQLTGAPTSNAMVRTTAAPTVIKGGIKDNVLPQEASAVVNFRVLPGDSIAGVTRHVKTAIDDPGIAVEVFGTANEPSEVSDMGSESFRVLRRTVREVFPKVVVAPALVIAATDSRHYRDVADNTYRFLPVSLTAERLAGMHGTNERLETESYADLIRFYIQLLRNSAG